jgi:hypothetical protein
MVSKARLDLPEPDEAGDHRQRLARDVDVDALEVVLARAADADVGEHERVCSRFVRARQGAAEPRKAL